MSNWLTDDFFDVDGVRGLFVTEACGVEHQHLCLAFGERGERLADQGVGEHFWWFALYMDLALKGRFLLPLSPTLSTPDRV